MRPATAWALRRLWRAAGGAPHAPLALDRSPDFLLELAGGHGDVVDLAIGPHRLLLLNSPAAARAVLGAQAHHFVKGRAHRRARAWLGSGLLVSHGEQHRQQRRLLQPAFHPRHAAACADLVVDHGLRRCAGWRPGQTYDIAAEMLDISLTVTAAFVCGADLSDEAGAIGAALGQLAGWFSQQSSPLAPLREHMPAARRLAATRAWLDGRIAQIIDGRRHAADGRPDALGLLLDTPGAQPRDQLLTLLLAGRETLAAALTWTWYLLAQHPAAELRLRAELATVLRGRPPTAADLPDLAYTRMVLAEALRRYPPAWLTSRHATAPCVVAGTPVSAGTTVLISQYTLHHDPRAFPAPGHFEPGRWRSPDAAMRQHYMPFGAGPRRCIGEPFVWLAGPLLIATLAQRARLRLLPGHPVALLPQTSLQPRYGMRMIVELAGGV